MAIVVDEKDNESMESIIMVDDGTGNGVKIPSVMVNEKQGEKLINWYEAGNNESRKRTQVVCTFDIVSPSLTRHRPSPTIELSMTFGSLHPTTEDLTLSRTSSSTLRDLARRPS